MLNNTLFTQSIQIQREALVSDAYGDQRQGPWATVSTVLGWFDSNLKKSAEQIANRDEAESDGICYIFPPTPGWADILPTDRLIIGGLIFQVFGMPAPIPVPGGIHHFELRVKRYSG